MEKGISKADWIDQVRRELNGNRSWEDLNWLVDEGLEIEPFYHPDDQILPLGPILWRGTNHWQIATWNKWPVDKQRLEKQIDYGVKCLILDFTALDDPMVKIEEVNLNRPSQFHFSLSHLQAANLQLKSSSEVAIRSSAALPVQHFFEISTREKGHVNQLVDIIQKLIISPQNCRSVLMIQIGQIYLAEIAKIRALKVIILNLWQNWDRDSAQLPEIECHIHSAHSTDPYTDLISKSCRAVQCVLAGCDRLVIHGHPDDELSSHLDVNIHHILRHEAWLDKVEDPLAGSFLVEKITHLFVERCWKRLKETWAGQIESK